MNWIIDANPCPGVFYGTPAQDGFLLRIRTPGGRLSLAQGRAIARWMEAWGSDRLQVTNRANLQLRSLSQAPTPEIFTELKRLGLAAPIPQVDQLRNIMASPTAGIDAHELLDTRPWVQALDKYIQQHRRLEALPAKFSIGVDGGAAVAIGTRSPLAWEHRYNEVQLSVVAADGSEADSSGWVHLAFGAGKKMHDTGCLIPPNQVVAAVAALTQAYLDYLSQAEPLPKPGRKRRMTHLLADWGLERYVQQATSYQPDAFVGGQQVSLSPSVGAAHLGVHGQRQPGLAYVGVDLPLGQLTLAQLQGVLAIVERFAPGPLRLTPWQSLIVANIAEDQVERVLEQLQGLGLSGQVPGLAIAACAGKPGCKSAATATQTDARRLLAELPQQMGQQMGEQMGQQIGQQIGQQMGLETPVNIHLTACPKSCAQPGSAEITLLGIAQDTYQLYLGDGRDAWKYDLGSVTVDDLSPLLGRVLQRYQQQRRSPEESLTAWARRSEQAGVRLQEWLS
ncbi:MAG: precorrin-3B synthase [Phormidium sp.]